MIGYFSGKRLQLHAPKIGEINITILVGIEAGTVGYELIPGALQALIEVRGIFQINEPSPLPSNGTASRVHNENVTPAN
jgi:hypothetical protein